MRTSKMTRKRGLEVFFETKKSVTAQDLLADRTPFTVDSGPTTRNTKDEGA